MIYYLLAGFPIIASRKRVANAKYELQSRCSLSASSLQYLCVILFRETAIGFFLAHLLSIEAQFTGVGGDAAQVAGEQFSGQHSLAPLARSTFSAKELTKLRRQEHRAGGEAAGGARAAAPR